jgi:phage baseplate assembly protein W
MAKIIINGLPQRGNVNKPYLYADLHLDLKKNYIISDELFVKPQINDIRIDYDINAVKNSLHNLFTTTPGDKILSPEYGMDLRKYLFEPATVQISKEIRDEIYIQVGTFEPRVKITSVNINVLNDANEYNITIYFDIPTLNIRNVSVFGTLNNNGYIYRN